MRELIYSDECYKLIGACFEVYREKGCGFTEPIYQESLEVELQMQGIPFERQRVLQLEYKGHLLKHGFVVDLVCYGKIILELKAVSHLVNEHRAQLLNYLSATGMKLGLLVNFGHHPKLEWERIVR